MPSASAPTVLILTGPPGVGKTTTAALLADRHGPAVHLESDVFFRFIRSGYVEPWRSESHEQNRVVMGIVGEAAAAYADAWSQFADLGAHERHALDVETLEPAGVATALQRILAAGSHTV